MNQIPMHIAISTSHDYLPYTCVMLSSLLSNNPDSIQFHILHQELNPADIAVLEKTACNYPATFHYYTVPTDILAHIKDDHPELSAPERYFYLYIPELLSPELERVLYLDSDLIVNGSLESFYFCDLNDKILAACQTEDHILEGVLLIHLNALPPFWSKLLTQPNSPDILLLDPLQYHLSAHAAYIERNLHYQDVKKLSRIIHFNGSKPWDGNCLHCDIEQLWWDSAKNTCFYESLMEHTMREMMLDDTLRIYISNIQQEHRQLKDIVEKYELVLKKMGISF